MVKLVGIAVAAGAALCVVAIYAQQKVAPLPEISDTLDTVTDFGQDAAGAIMQILPGSVQLTRGLRNNNPGNVVYDGTEWVGLTGNDGRYCIFDTMANGCRAMYRILRSYNNRGLDTVSEIISTWAPSIENDTASYISHVARKMNVSATDRLALDMSQMADLIEAIIVHENGYNPVSRDVIVEGILSA